MASILSTRKTKVNAIPLDQVYVIYGKPGTGKTVLASTFPKPMLYIDILEGGTGSISTADTAGIDVVRLETFEELDEVLEDVLNGFTLDASGSQVPVKYNTIVIDSLTQMEYLLKKYLKEVNGKPTMNLNLWGQNRDNQENIYNTLKYIHVKTGSIVVAIAHEKEIKDENNPGFNRIVPNLQTSVADSLCAKASFVWYTKVEATQLEQPDGSYKEAIMFNTYIDAYPYVSSKCRKPKEFVVPNKITNLRYETFKKNILDKMRKEEKK